MISEYKNTLKIDIVTMKNSKEVTQKIKNRTTILPKGFPGGINGKKKKSACQCRRYKRHRLEPFIGKIPRRRAWQPTLVFLPGESHGQRSLAG